MTIFSGELGTSFGDFEAGEVQLFAVASTFAQLRTRAQQWSASDSVAKQWFSVRCAATLASPDVTTARQWMSSRTKARQWDTLATRVVA